MRESRTPENKQFEKFFEIVRAEAAKTGCIFFGDCGEGRELFSDDMEGEDLFGWLIPENLADEFEPEWRKNDVSERWDDYTRFAIWHDESGQITISFEDYSY